MEQDKILEKVEDIIKENFPFYTSYKINKNTPFKDSYEIQVNYYYMGEETTFIQLIPRYSLKKTNIEKTLEKMEFVLDGFKSSLIKLRKDLISYSNNKAQQDFLKEKRD